MIGLITGQRVINNLVFIEDVSKDYVPAGKSLLSVTVLDTELPDKE
jgi:hypothetical protein